MSTLRTKQIKTKLLELFEDHLDLRDIGERDKERETKVLSRCLAAFSIYSEFGCSAQEAANAVWDRSDDNGIDAGYYDPATKRAMFVQSKWISSGSGEPEAKDIAVFINGMQDIINEDISPFAAKLHKRILDITRFINQPGTSFVACVISTGKSALAKHADGKIRKFIKTLNGNEPDEIASSRVIGLNEVYNFLATDISSKEVDIDATIIDWRSINEPYHAFYGSIDGVQLKRLWDEHGKRLLTSNIRYSLGATDINSAIVQTATESPEHFWYFNNGITIVAKGYVKSPKSAAHSAGVFTFKSASIVNGAQTVSSLSKVVDPATLAKVKLTIRVVILANTPEKFGAELTKAANFQNRVEPRDFVANDQEQRRIQKEMAIEGINYQFLRSGDTQKSEKSCELLEVLTALACEFNDPTYAVMIKTGYSRFFEDLTKAPYKALFNASISGAFAFNAVTVLREVDKWIAAKKSAIWPKSGPGWGALIHGNRILAACVFAKIGRTLLESSISEFSVTVATLKIPDLCEKTHVRMSRIVSKELRDRFAAVMYKNFAVCKLIYQYSSK